MALHSKVGVIQSRATTGNQSYTGVGFQPKLVIFYKMFASADGSRHMFGVAMSASQEWSCSYDNQHNLSTANENSAFRNDACIADEAAGSELRKADFVSMDADGFTLNWSIASTAQDVNYLALGGDDLDVDIGTFNLATSTGNQSVTGIGFQPKGVMFANCLDNVTPGFFTGAANWSLGVGVSSSSRWAMAAHSQDNTGAATNGSALVVDKCLIRSSATAIAHAADFVSNDADGFTINVTSAPASPGRMFGYLALGGAARFAAGTFAQATSTGNQSVTGVGFQPAAVFFAGRGKASGTTTTSGAAVMIGAAVSSSSQSVGYDSSLHNADPTDTSRFRSTSSCIVATADGGATALAQAAFVSHDADGFTVNNTTVDATSRVVAFLAIGAAVSDATDVTLSGPTSGEFGVASSNFTVGANGPITGTVGVFPSDGGAGGTFTPTDVEISNGTPTATFTYTPAALGTATISVTNDGGLADPADIDYESLPILQADGIWTWYTDPRAIFRNGATYFGSISEVGNVRISKYVHATGQKTHFTLAAALEVDDHDNPAVYFLPDGKIVCNYAKHSTDSTQRYRVSTNAEDISAWGSEQTFSASGTTSYSNPVHVADDTSNPHWLFYRVIGTGSQIAMRKTANHSSWASEALVFDGTGTFRPYVKLIGNGTDRIDFLITDMHPANGQCSVYHFYMLWQSGAAHWYKSDGTEITASLPFGPSDVTLVSDGSSIRRWNWDIAYDGAGNPMGVGTRYPGNNGSDIRYMFWRWNGSSWDETEVTSAGTSLYAAEVYYTGGICFDAADPFKLYVSKEVSGIYELQVWASSDNGASWSKSEDITTGSAVDQARPFSPRGHNGEVPVLWWTGEYTSYTDYDTAIHAVIQGAAAALAGAAAAQAAAAGALTTGIPLLGSAVSQATATGALSTQIRLAGVAASVTVATGALTTQIRLTSAALAQAAASGTLDSGAAQLAGAAAGQATAAGQITTSILLAGAAIAAAVAQAQLTTGIRLAGAAGGQAAGVGELAGGPPQLAGSAQAVVVAGGSLTTGIPLAGAAVSVSVAQGLLVTEIRLTAAALAQAIAAGGLTTQVRFSGAAVANAIATGSLAGAQLEIDQRFIARARPRRYVAELRPH